MGFIDDEKELGLDDVISFGKYKGKSIHQILNLDSSYLVWANNTIDWFKLKEGVLAEAIDRAFQEKIQYQLERINWSGVDVYDFMD
jgi:hypothetical protein